MNQTKTTYVGKNAVCVLVNLILSVICFAGCIVTFVIVGDYGEDGLIALLVIDMTCLVAATVAMFFNGETSMFIYLGGVLMSFIAFCTQMEYGGIAVLLILLPIFQGVCAIFASFVDVTIGLLDEFLYTEGKDSGIVMPYQSIDYLSTGKFSRITFKTSAGGISCCFVRDAKDLFKSVYDKRKERVQLNKCNETAQYSQSVIIDELPEL